MTLSTMAERCYAECHLCLLSFMLSVTYKLIMLIVVMLNVVMMTVIVLSVVAPFYEYKICSILHCVCVCVCVCVWVCGKNK
jgi:hypothetical protein